MAVQGVAIIGAGPAGLAAAYELGRHGIGAVVFEKSRGVSGRAATRRRGRVRFDHGANFFRTSDPEVHELVHEILPTDQLVEIPGEVWTFDRQGTIGPGDPVQNAEPRFTYRDGISTLGKLLAVKSGAEVRLRQRVARLEQNGRGWDVFDESGALLGSFDSVIVTIPAPQAAHLLDASDFDESLRRELSGALRSARYRAQFTFVLGYGRRLRRPEPFHALVNKDGGHPVAWLSFEEDKPGHVPDDESVVVVQTAPRWSSSRLEVPREQLLEQVVSLAGEVLPGLGASSDWWDSQRWMLAHPQSAAGVEALRRGQDMNLFFAGDGLVGKGRVPLALKSGLQTAQRILERHVFE